jgi:hypothetical protein
LANFVHISIQERAFGNHAQIPPVSIREIDDQRSCDGRPGPRQGVWQAPGSPQDYPLKIGRIRAALDEGRGVRETARLLKVSAAKVSVVRRNVFRFERHCMTVQRYTGQDEAPDVGENGHTQFLFDKTDGGWGDITSMDRGDDGVR